MKPKRWLVSALCLAFMLLAVIPAMPSSAASGPSIITTLTDQAVQRGSKKTFDVWARNAAGDKINTTVTFNGQKISPTWDDTEKASYTLVFTHEGENTVVVSASSDGGKKKQLTYRIYYQRTAEGEPIGKAVWSVEMFTIGCGYLICPLEMDILEGETAAEQLVRLLQSQGYVGYYGGTVKSAFYLAYIADGNSALAQYNGYQKSEAPPRPQKLNISPAIPAMLEPYLSDTMTFFDAEDYGKNWTGYLGEFVFTNGSGWMYSVNNVFPNVGFADSYLSDGDVVRVQFTLAYGADIGGFGAIGADIPNVDNQPASGYFLTADKDELTKAIGKALSSGLLSYSNIKKAYSQALSVMAALNASKDQVDAAVRDLRAALQDPQEAATQHPTAEASAAEPSVNVTTSNSGLPGNTAAPYHSSGTAWPGSSHASMPAASGGAQLSPDGTAPAADASAGSSIPQADHGMDSVDRENRDDRKNIGIAAGVIAALTVLSAAAICIFRRKQRIQK